MTAVLKIVEENVVTCCKFEESLPGMLSLRKTVCSKCETHVEKIMSERFKTIPCLFFLLNCFCRL
jgi:hypothetical protein